MLLLLLLFVQDDPAVQVKTLRDDYAKAEIEYYREYRAAKTPEERAKAALDPAKHPARAYVPKFAELAGRAKGTEAGARAQMEILRLAQMVQMIDEARAALDALVADYLAQPALAELPRQLPYAGWMVGNEKVLAALRAIAEKGDVKAKPAAAYYLAYTIMYQNNGSDPKGEARKALETLQKDYPDAPENKNVEQLLFELDHLQVGKEAPDFETADQDGKPWKLSDYRGKVVVVDFWGFW